MKRVCYAPVHLYLAPDAHWAPDAVLGMTAEQTWRAARRLGKGYMSTVSRDELEHAGQLIPSICEMLLAELGGSQTWPVPQRLLPRWMALLERLAVQMSEVAEQKSGRASLPRFLPALFPPIGADAGAYGVIGVASHVAAIERLDEAIRAELTDTIAARLRFFRLAREGGHGVVELVLPSVQIWSDESQNGE